MVLDYIPFTFVNDASTQLGVSISKTTELVSKGLLETMKTGGKELFNNKVLDQYVKEHGGVKERCRDLILKEIEKEQVNEIIQCYKIIKLTKSNQSRIKTKSNHSKEEKKVIDKYNMSKDFNINTDATGKIFNEDNYEAPFFTYFKSYKEVEHFYDLIIWKSKIDKMEKNILVFEKDRAIIDYFYYIYNNEIEEVLNVRKKFPNSGVAISLLLRDSEYIENYYEKIDEYNEINFLKYSDIKEIILRCRKKLNYKA